MPSRPTTNRMLSRDWALDCLNREREQIELDLRLFERKLADPGLSCPSRVCDLVESLGGALVDLDRVYDQIAGLRR
jgi:hypothetical protein